MLDRHTDENDTAPDRVHPRNAPLSLQTPRALPATGASCAPSLLGAPTARALRAAGSHDAFKRHALYHAHIRASRGADRAGMRGRRGPVCVCWCARAQAAINQSLSNRPFGAGARSSALRSRVRGRKTTMWARDRGRAGTWWTAREVALSCPCKHANLRFRPRARAKAEDESFSPRSKGTQSSLYLTC